MQTTNLKHTSSSKFVPCFFKKLTYCGWLLQPFLNHSMWCIRFQRAFLQISRQSGLDWGCFWNTLHVFAFRNGWTSKGRLEAMMKGVFSSLYLPPCSFNQVQSNINTEKYMAGIMSSEAAGYPMFSCTGDLLVLCLRGWGKLTSSRA